MPATETPPFDTPAAAAPSPARLAGWLRLQHTPRIGLLSARKLLDALHTPQAIFSADDAALRAIVSRAQAAALRQPPAAPDELQARLDAILAWCGQPGNQVLAMDDPAYPAALREIPDAPLLLYVKGRAELLARPALAVVGSRNCSTQGMQIAARMAQSLSEAGVAIVSGLALGIDAAAHTGGLRGVGSTVAVVGTGADRIYPARNRELALQIAEQGCIVSEYGLGTPPVSENFPRRNRVISGLARGVLVVEAAARSGSLITARLAASQGRDVYAIPGSIHATLAKGCHILIREGAKLVDSAADILDDMGWLAGLPAPAAAGWRPALDDSFVDRVLTALGQHPCSADVLGVRLGQAPAQLQGQLLALELAGLIERLPGGMFQRLYR